MAIQVFLPGLFANVKKGLGNFPEIKFRYLGNFTDDFFLVRGKKLL